MSDTYRTDLFAGKEVLVSGGTSGIGAAVGNAFSALGARVTVTGGSQNEVDAARAAPDFAANDARVLDVRDMSAIELAIAAMPRLDILVNCAGMIRRNDEHRIDVFEDVIDVNLTGTMRMCVAARSRIAAGRGSIVNVASILSFFAGPIVPAYSASKGGVAQLTKSLAIAYAAEGIRVNAVAPGWVATALTGALRESPERSAAIIGRTPLGRWAEPAEIADAVLFLCSPASRFMTGTVMLVDGGYSVV
ncbi:MAG: SDR family oxidoreductase [Casimicrobiaceae bacterium]